MNTGEYVTIWEDFELPSKGLIYDKVIDPKVSLRSMTTAEEMKRLSPTETPYKVMSDIIEDCMKDKPKIHVCDMCIGDYQFLLHKLRVVTYGKEYKMVASCPYCGNTEMITANLDNIDLHIWDSAAAEKKLITLPVTNFTIELNFQTPHDLDLIAYRAKEMKKEKKNNLDYSMLFTVMSLIKKIDGREPVNQGILKDFVWNLPTRDVIFILNRATELAKEIGLDNNIKVDCSNCGKQFDAPFRITSEFFGPSEN